MNEAGDLIANSVIREFVHGDVKCALEIPRTASLGFSNGYPDTWSRVMGTGSDLISAACKGHTVIDVGAFVGDTALLFSRFWSARHVVAVEASPENFRYMSRNVELNGLGGVVTAVNASAGSSCGSAKERRSVRSGEKPAYRSASSREDVSSTTVDRLVQSLGITDTGLVKVSAGGFECDVLDGAVRTIADQRPVIVLELWLPGMDPGFGVDTADNFMRAVHTLSGLGYVMYCRPTRDDYVFAHKEAANGR